MRSWPSQTFALILLGLLAALSFWLEHAVDVPLGKQDGKLRHDPDTIVENFMVRRISNQGILQYRMRAPYMEHYPDDDSSLLKQPHLIHYRPGAPDMTLSGQQARVTAKGETVYLWGGVVVTRAASSERPEMVARTPDLTVKPDDGTATTDSPAEITEGASWLKGVGMDVDNNQSTLSLRSQVTGLIFRAKQQP
ncbi:MAG: LPS export ABC transporter periplasmic protein LptC [Sphingomonadales bacterium]|nr:LPS export ABC transporter periplasmic protein LptC [Sphingomonadales bacterium]